MLSYFRYRRQFLLSTGVVPELQHWQHRQIGDLHLLAHPDLGITDKKDASTSIILLGDIFDPQRPERTNDDIISDAIPVARSFDQLLAVIKPYVGRYALVYRDETNFFVLHDPLGLREVYYCTTPNKVICGSQPNLLDAFSEPALGVTQDASIRQFYDQDMKAVRSGRLWVGDETFYRDVKHLTPNHYLDLRTLTAKRYWPNRKLEPLQLETAVRLACSFLRGTLRAIGARYSVMMAVTSGLDSRSLLAASRDLQDTIYYFVNKEPPLSDRSADIQVPRELFKRLNIPFHIHDVDGPVDDEFKDIFLANVFMATERILPTIYNVYFKHHQNKVNLLGVGEIGREYYGKAPRNLTGYYLARCLKYKRSRYATIQCEKWLLETQPFTQAYNVDIMRLLLWECLLGTWGVVGNSESDIAIEEFDPYDSHYLYEILLSVDRTKGDFFEALFREMWPELLEFPFNPPQTAAALLRNWLIRLRVFQFLKVVGYKFDHWRYRRVVERSQI